MKWGCFRAYMTGPTGKWSALRPTRVMHYGDGYRLTRDEARANAELDLSTHQARHPGRKIEIRESTSQGERT